MPKTSKMQSTKTLTKIIRQPSIAKLITQLDELGYELYIKPKKDAKYGITRKESTAKNQTKS